ncbi:MAG: hypothetical protein RR347_08565 [Anaerovoracaceae bacterium]
MAKKLIFDEYINDAVRILIIANAVANAKKSIKLTEYRIRLYDYYLRFPHTMFNGIATGEELRVNFDEYYAFFHWKPDLIKYRRSINLLVAKGLLLKKLEDNDVLYSIDGKGIEALEKLISTYKQRLISLSLPMIKEVSKLSDSKIEEEISRKSNILAREAL